MSYFISSIIIIIVLHHFITRLFCVLKVFFFSSIVFFDSHWFVFSLDLTVDGLYAYFVDHEEVSDHQSIVLGLRQLNSSETDHFCFHSPSKDFDSMLRKPFEFMSTYSIRSFLSGCYYLDSKGRWKSDGMQVRTCSLICVDRSMD